MARRRVMMVIGLFRPAVGGAELQAEALARELVRRGVEVSVVTARTFPESPLLETTAGVAIHRLRTLAAPKIGKYLFLLSVAAFLLRRRKSYDIVHCHQALGASAIGVAVASVLRKPSLVKVSNSGRRFDLAVLRGSYAIGGWLAGRFRRAGALVVLNEEMRADLAAAGIPGDLLVRLPNGVDTRRFSPTPFDAKGLLKAAAGLDPALPAILCLGSLQAKKNVGALVEAVGILADRGVRCTAVVAGDGPDREALQRLAAERTPPGAVRFVGADPAPERWFAACEVFVLPSLVEGMSNALLEARSAGLVPVVSRVPGNAEAVREGETGFLFDPSDPADLAARLAPILADPAAFEPLGRAARREVVRGFALDAVAARYEELYDRLFRPRIVYVVGTLVVGGAERHLLSLAAAMRRAGYETAVVALRGGRMLEEFRAAGVPVRVVGKRWKFDPLLLWRLRAVIAEFRPDVLHTFMFTANAWGRAAGILARAPVMVASERSVDLWKRPHHVLLDRILARRTARILCVSPRVAERYRRLLGLGALRVPVIPNGVDAAALRAAATGDVRAELGLGSAPTVLAGGRLSPEKGIDVLLRAVPAVRVAVPAARFVVAGEGPERERLEALARELGVADAVVFAGYRDNLPSFLAAADAVVLSSLWEGMPNLLLEAMAFAKPVIGPEAGGAADIVRDGWNGFLVPPGDPAALADRIVRLLADPEGSRRMGRAGYDMVVKQHRTADVMERYRRFYEAIMPDERTRACAPSAE